MGRDLTAFRNDKGRRSKSKTTNEVASTHLVVYLARSIFLRESDRLMEAGPLLFELHRFGPSIKRTGNEDVGYIASGIFPALREIV